jgi:hypothetical protein
MQARLRIRYFPILPVALGAALVLVGCGSSTNKAGSSGSPNPARIASSPSPSLDPATAAYVQVVMQVSELFKSDQTDWVNNCEHLVIAGCKQWVATDQGVLASAIAKMNAGHPPSALAAADVTLKQAVQLGVNDDAALLSALNSGDTSAITAADDKLVKDYTNVQLPAMQAIAPSIQQ